VGLTLATDDPNSVKAFSRQTRGTVLGFTFDTVSSTCLLPEGKFDEVARLAEEALLPGGEGLPLEDIQKLLGKLESVAQLFPFMKGFRWQLLQWLRAALVEPDRPARLPKAASEDLKIWIAALKTAKSGLPIAKPPNSPPIGTLNLVSNAAGRPPPGSSDSNGGTSIGIDKNTCWFAASLKWPLGLMWAAQDKTSIYEAIAMIIPFLTTPNCLRHRRIHLFSNNIAVVWAWEKRHTKEEALTSIIIRTLHILEAYLPCKIFVSHLPRVSTPSAATADRLTRSSTTTASDRRLLTHNFNHFPQPFLKWIHNPSMNWNLAREIIETWK